MSTAPSSLPFDALIFDLDGTLCDSLEDIAVAMNEALAAHGLPGHPLEAYKTKVGEGVVELVHRALPPGDVEHVQPVLGTYRDAYRAGGHARTFPYEGIPGMLSALVERRLPLAVLSNKRDEFVKALVAQRLGGVPFKDVRGERDGVPRKPNPQAALELAEVLGVAPSRVGFVGDTAIDMKTANAAGMVAVGVLWGFRGREELVEAGARHLLTRPAELLGLRAAESSAGGR